MIIITELSPIWGKKIAQSCKYLNLIYLAWKTAKNDRVLYKDQFLTEETNQFSTEDILHKTNKQKKTTKKPKQNKQTKKKEEHGKGATLSSVTFLRKEWEPVT